jgi:hypothetical protein
MLEKLLVEIQTSGTLHTAVLANRLGTSVAMVEAMIGGLKRRGLLREVSLNGEAACGGCPLATSCVSSCKRSHLWQVTGFYSDNSKQSELQTQA